MQIQILTETADLENACTDTNGGICNFRAFPGDSGVYMDETSGDAGFPANTMGLRVFISSTDFVHANPNDQTLSQDLQIQTNGTIPNEFVSGLNNDPPNPYYFRVAALDLANNVFAFTSDANILNFGNCTTACTAGPPVTCTGSEGAAGAGAPSYITDGCRYVAEPDQVLGLLSNDLNCFIATAAYGSSLEPKLGTFRAFRHRFLLLNPYGRRFVEKYYQWGPYAARWIYDHDWARPIVRAGLWPVWAFAELSLHWGLRSAALAAFTGLTLFAAVIIGLASWMRKSVAKRAT